RAGSRICRVPHAAFRAGNGVDDGLAAARPASDEAASRGVATMSVAPLLDVSGLSMRFGGLLAVDNVAFSVAPQEVFAIIGPNGAGKTTVFNCVGGFYRPTSGHVTMSGKSIA